MAIKMRHNRDGSSKCCNCGAAADNTLGMYDVMVGGYVFTICDVCNGELLSKTLSAEVGKNSRTKSGKDMAVIRSRCNGTYTGGGAGVGRTTRYSVQYDA